MSAPGSRWVRGLCAITAVAVGSVGACSGDEATPDTSATTTESAVLLFDARDPAVIVQALRAAGVQICGELLLPIPNEGYRYEDTRKLTLTVEGGGRATRR